MRAEILCGVLLGAVGVSSAQAADETACGIFIDKVTGNQSRNTESFENVVKLYAKVSPEVLELGPVRVYAQQQTTVTGYGSGVGEMTEYDLAPILGSKDYFMVQNTTAWGYNSVGSAEWQTEIELFVESADGKLWSSGVFFVDENLRRTAPAFLDLSWLPKTADLPGVGEYLNPEKCR